MKKKLFYVLAMLCAAAICAASFAACSGSKNDETDDDKGGSTVQPDDDKDENDDDKEDNDGDDGKDEPETPVYTEVLSDGGVIFKSTNQTTLALNSGNGDVWVGDAFVDTIWTFEISLNWGGYTSMLSDKSQITSSDQSVIPAEAVSYKTRTSGSSNTLTGINIQVDTTKINAGKTWLEMYFRAGNGVSNEGTVCVEITVTDKLVLETMQNGVKIDFGKYAEEGDDILVRFFDNDHINNSYIGEDPAPSYVQVAAKVDEDGTATFNFTYIKGHEYTISICKGTEWFTSLAPGEPDRERVLMLKELDVVSSGSTQTGFNQYVKGMLSFVTEGAVIELEVEGTYEELY